MNPRRDEISDIHSNGRIYPIVKYGDPILERPAALVTEFDTQELHDLIASMFITMYSVNGLGLAAPQIGVALQIAVIFCDHTQLVLINPQITETEGTQVGEEGCLSLPGFPEQIERSSNVTVKAQNPQGKHFEINSSSELMARAMEHEIDHLRGELYINRISPLKRGMIRKRIQKLAKNGKW